MNVKHPHVVPAKSVVDSISRRGFITASGVMAVATTLSSTAWGAASKRYRVAVIGHTGRGNYGHGLDTVWLELPTTKIVAVADADEKGRREAVKRLGNVRGFSDYRRMLDEIKPELVSIGPRWIDQRRDMVVAAAERGVRGIYLEKPMCRNLIEADQIVAACEKYKVKLAIGTQTRYSPKVPIIEEMIRDGMLGRIVEFRARGKDDHRGGGEDLWVLGTHMLDLMRHFGGDAQWCFASVYDRGQPVTARHVKPGNEGIGPLAGDEIHATYRLSGGATGYWDSVRDAQSRPTRFGIRIHGTKGVVELYDTGLLPYARFLPESNWSAGRTGKDWIPISSAGIGQPEPLEKGGLHEGNVAAVQDLISAMETDRQPIANVYEARKTVEMIAAVFESHRVGRPVTLPLQNRQNPLTMLGR